MSKYIFVTGGVISGLGKGIAAASMGMLLENHGYKITIQKFDPYLNVDPGTMSPFQHGEVYVTDDGAETDLDLGHYERFTSTRTTRDHNWTAGRIYESLIRKERKGEYLGKTVQVIPHVTDEIKKAFTAVADRNQIVICEIGGTVGDIESLPFLEATRQMRLTLGADNVLFVHLTLVPSIGTSGELKTKPTQHSVKELRAIGIQPDILLCRTSRPLSPDIKSKIALFTNVPLEAVISARDVHVDLRDPALLRRRGAGRDHPPHAPPAAPQEEPGPLGSPRRPHQEPQGRGRHRPRRQVRRAPRRLHEPQPGPHPRRHRQPPQGQHRLDRGRGPRRDATRPTILGDEGRHPRPGRLRQAGHRGQDPGRDLRPREQRAVLRHLPRHAGRRHRVRPLAGRAAEGPTAPSSRPTRRTRSSSAGASSARTTTWAARCGSARTAATSRRARSPTRPTAGSGSPSATATATSSTRSTRSRWSGPGCASRAGTPTTGWSRSSEVPGHPWFLGCQFHPEFKSKPLEPHPLFKAFIAASYANRLRRAGTGPDTARPFIRH